MIEIGGATLDFSDPVILGLGVVGVLLLVLILVILRGTRRSVHASEPVMQQMMMRCVLMADVIAPAPPSCKAFPHRPSRGMLCP